MSHKQAKRDRKLYPQPNKNEQRHMQRAALAAAVKIPAQVKAQNAPRRQISSSLRGAALLAIASGVYGTFHKR